MDALAVAAAGYPPDSMDPGFGLILGLGLTLLFMRIDTVQKRRKRNKQ